MRLLLIIPELSLKIPGGIATYYRNLLPALRDVLGTIDVLVANPYGSDTELWSCEGVCVDRLPEELLRRHQKRFSHLEMFPFLSRSMASAWAAYAHVQEKSTYDLVNVVDWGLPFVPWLLESSNVPLIVTMHGSAGQMSLQDPIAEYQLEGFFTRLLEKVFLANAQGIVSSSAANTEFWQNTLSRDVCGILPAFEVPGDGSGLRGSQDLPAKEGLVVARLQKLKGPRVVCRALAQLDDPDIRIRWVGRETASLRKDTFMGTVLAEEFPYVFGRLLTHEPSLPYEEVRKLQSSSAFNLIPSNWDVFNLTVVESLLSARPTICSSGNGAVSLIRHGENGFVFPAEDANTLATVIRQVRDLTVNEQKHMAEAAYQTVSEELSPRKIARKTAEYFSEIASQKPQKCRMEQSWIADFVSPDGAKASVSDFLENIPLKQVAGHVVRRSEKKLFTR